MADPPKSFQETVRELWELLTSYARQETVGPFKDLGRRIGLGIGGSFAFALGWFLITLGVVRVLATHEVPGLGRFFMDHDWVVYLIAVALLGLGMFIAYRRIQRQDPALASTPSSAASTSTRSS